MIDYSYNRNAFRQGVNLKTAPLLVLYCHFVELELFLKERIPTSLGIGHDVNQGLEHLKATIKSGKNLTPYQNTQLNALGSKKETLYRNLIKLQCFDKDGGLTKVDQYPDIRYLRYNKGSSGKELLNVIQILKDIKQIMKEIGEWENE